MMPACNSRFPSLVTLSTVALEPNFSSSTVSPARMARVAAGRVFCCGLSASFSSASLSVRRSAACRSLEFCTSALSFIWRRSCLSSSCTAFAVRRASSMMYCASRFACCTALSRSRLIWSKYSSLFCCCWSVCWRSRSASARACSICCRCCSSCASTSSKSESFWLTRLFALSRISSCKPSLREMANALDFPGTPTSSR